MFPKNIIRWIISLSLGWVTLVLAAENPDELYRQGRFAEAEKAYAQYDMDHTKDVRFRYNRGCAAFQNSDYQSARAAFASVLRRAKDDDIRFRAAYNLANTAFKQGDFESAVAHFKQALVYNSDSEDARYNLEVALRELENAKKDQAEQQKAQDGKDSSQSEDQNEQGQKSENGKNSDQSSKEKESEQQQSQTRDQTQKQGQKNSDQGMESKKDKNDSDDQGESAENESPQDLSGDLQALQALPEENEPDKTASPAVSVIDKKMAEALLDNIEEDRTRFLRFQIPKEKRHGVQSGKDW